MGKQLLVILKLRKINFTVISVAIEKILVSDKIS